MITKPNVFLKGVMIVAAGVILAWCLWVSDSTLSTQVAVAELHTGTWNTSTAAGDNWDSETGVDLSVVTDVYYSL